VRRTKRRGKILPMTIGRHGIFVFLIAFAGVAGGCGRTPLLPGEGQDWVNGAGAGAGGPGGSGGSRGSGGAGGAVTSYPTHFTGPEVQSALTSCDLPHGAPVNIDTGDQESAHVLGTWLICPSSGNVGFDTPFAPGIQFRADGTFSTLAASDDGGLDTGTGFQKQGEWSAFCEMSSIIKNSQPCHGGGVYYYSTIYIQLHVAGGGDNRATAAVGPITFESSPTRAYVVDYPGWFDANEGDTSIEFWMVPLP